MATADFGPAQEAIYRSLARRKKLTMEFSANMTQGEIARQILQGVIDGTIEIKPVIRSGRIVSWNAVPVQPKPDDPRRKPDADPRRTRPL